MPAEIKATKNFPIVREQVTDGANVCYAGLREKGPISPQKTLQGKQLETSVKERQVTSTLS